MLPYRWRFTNTFSIGIPEYRAVDSMIRMLAWWGTIRSTSSLVMPASSRTQVPAAAIDFTADLKTSLPDIRSRCSLLRTASSSRGSALPPADRCRSDAMSPSARW